MWSLVPVYEKLNLPFCIKMAFYGLIGSFEAKEQFQDYLAIRKIRNERYKNFWSDTSNIIFNDDKTRYLCIHLDNVEDIKVE